MEAARQLGCHAEHQTEAKNDAGPSQQELESCQDFGFVWSKKGQQTHSD